MKACGFKKNFKEDGAPWKSLETKYIVHMNMNLLEFDKISQKNIVFTFLDDPKCANFDLLNFTKEELIQKSFLFMSDCIILNKSMKNLCRLHRYKGVSALSKPFSQQIFCRSRKSTGITNAINCGSVLFKCPSKL